MDTLVVLPVLLPLGCAALSLLLARRPRAQRVVGVLGSAGLLGAGAALLAAAWREGVVVSHLGGWPAPFAVTLACDVLGAALVAVTGLLALAVALYSLGSVDPAHERAGYWPLFHALLMGVCGAFVTGDLFNLYVWFEVLLMASFALMALGGGRAQLEGAVKYFVLSVLSSVLFLTAVGLLYGATGTLNLARLSLVVPERVPPGLRDALAMLFLGAFGLKAAVFPLFAWLPASYPTAPPAVSALFAGLLTKVGVYALIRTFTLVFPYEGSATVILPAIAALTMVTGVLGAAAQVDVRRVLSFHIVSQIGYMVLGLAWATPLALAATVFYLVHHIVTKTNLFLVAGLVRRLRGTEELARLGGLATSRPLVAVLFLVPALSLAGVPPLSGFWAKLLVLRAGLAVEAWWLVGAAAAVGLLTVYSMTKIWTEAFWKPAPAEPAGAAAGGAPPWTMLAPVALLAAVTVGLGLAAGPVLALAERAAEQLSTPAIYVEAVLGAGGRG